MPNLFRMSLKELKDWQEKLYSDPDYCYPGEDLSPAGIAKKMEVDHVVMARDVPCPYDDPIEPGSLVYLTWEGYPAKWLEGTIYVAKRHLEKKE